MTTGQYGGIGALIRRNGDYAIIAEPYKDFPAAKNDVRAGDTILYIDDESMKGKEITSVSEKLKGKPGTEVKLNLKRYGVAEPIDKILIREKININNVPYYGMIDNEIGYIRLSNFTTNAALEVKDAFVALNKEHMLSGIVLDLRNNPGGLLIEAVDVANIFIDQGQEIVSTRGRVNQWDYIYKTRHSSIDTEIPIAVLVNRSSASASEIVAGSMQDLDRGVIIGQRTFGKGLVQATRDLAYNSKLKVTTAKYYIPSGRCIQALDFTNRNPDGSVGTIPDSLISEFKTSNGRIVYDGGGIMPDTITEPEEFSQFAISLYTQNVIFDYATIFATLNPSIPAISTFTITDDIYTHFSEYVKSRDFSYTTRSEETLEELKKIAQREKYYDLSKEEFIALGKKLAHNNEKDLSHFREEISRLLKQEIVTRYSYQWAGIEVSIQDDQEILKAIDILKDTDCYLSLLAVKKLNVHAKITE